MDWRRVVLIGCAVVVLYDTLIALVVELGDASYGGFWTFTYVVYAVTAFVVGRRTGSVRLAVLAGLAVAAADVALGGTIAWLIASDAPGLASVGSDLLLLIVAAALVSGALLGLVGGLVGRATAARGRSAELR